MKKISNYLVISIFLIFIFLLGVSYIYAGTINFDKSNVNVNSGESFTLELNVDPGSDEIRSVDIYLSYDKDYLQVEAINEGDYFPTVTSDTSTAGQVYIAGMVDDPAVTKTGTGKVATVNFKAIKNGSTTITLNCERSKIIKADIDATNILECPQTPPSVNVTIGGGGSSGNTYVTPTPTPKLPSSLPKSGVFDNIEKALKPGFLFLVLGIVLKLIIL